ncbi:hypothetical protein AB0L05_41230, partial [Nonomuraea pusilla]|uniref:hypothetical protein n=1 Tax=Nonomuraea pusilla TaxID=46177 RepID=UPI003444FEE3
MLLGAPTVAVLALLVLAGLLVPAAAAFLAVAAALGLLLLLVRRLDGRAHRIELRAKRQEAELARARAALGRWRGDRRDRHHHHVLARPRGVRDHHLELRDALA